MDSPEPNKARLPRLVALAVILVLGLALLLRSSGAMEYGVYAYLKLFGAPNDCPWAQFIGVRTSAPRLLALLDENQKNIKVAATDDKLGIEQTATSGRSFWVKTEGKQRDGKHLIAYLLADHTWMGEQTPEWQVKPGDIVIDCGAHVGVFTDKALQRGAAKVIAVEPDKVNLECLRRNFAPEIASGKVVVYPKGVWSSQTTLKLSVSHTNSGMNSVVHKESDDYEEIEVTTIDKLVAELGLSKVDYIKMDIEGAEREALAGAAATLRQHRPRLMLDSYHRPDDPQVLPKVIRQARADYAYTCGPCEYIKETDRFLPHVVYYH